MLPEIITFSKTMQYRLQEYEQLFDGLETPCSEVIEVWGSIFEDLAIIGVGWQALWILSEGNCKKYDLLYPTAVIVNVDEFTWNELTATVTVLAVQEDIIIPQTIVIPVIELHPIKIQDYDETDLRDIEDWLDKCRYFFKNLWYPWDAKLDASIMDWCDSHLRNRLKMQYDIRNGVFDKAIANYLKLLLAEAQNINAISDKSFSEEDNRVAVVKRYIRRKIIKSELDLFEEPDLRYGMILLKRQEKHLRNSEDNLDNRDIKFVWTDGSCQSLLHYLEITQTVIDKNASFKVFGSAQEALDCSSMGDTIILPPGTHIMNSLRGIRSGGLIKGLVRNETLIVPDRTTIPKAILFECFGLVELENLIISKTNGIVIQVFGGALKLNKCKIISGESNSTSKGIVVVSGSQLFLKDCELEGFGTVIALQADASASITGTKISNAFEGIKVIESASLLLQNVSISSCSTFGIRIESSKVNSDIPLVGDLDLLMDNNFSCNISVQSVSFNDNKKGNVILKQLEPALNFEESLKSDVSSEVICISDREDFEENSVEEIQLSFNKVL